MQVLTPSLISGKRVLLRYDIDVPLKEVSDSSTKMVVADDFRLLAGIETLDFCLQHAKEVILMGHLSRPDENHNGRIDPSEHDRYSVAPIVDWFEQKFRNVKLPEGKFHIMENLRFEEGEDECSLDFARELATYGDVFINEAFAAHHKAASTTLLPKLLPHAAGFNFAEEVEELSLLRNKPRRPYIAVIGGAKVEDKLPAVLSLAGVADAVLVGGKVASEIKEMELSGQLRFLPVNIHLAKMNVSGTDITMETLEEWSKYLTSANTILWNGPMGKFEEKENAATHRLASLLSNMHAEKILGGGDTVSAVQSYGMLKKFNFVSTGGGAMLKFLIEGTLPTIEALK